MRNERRTLNWHSRDAQGQYYRLMCVDLTAPYFNKREGVYVIWHEDQNGDPIAVDTGQGDNIRYQDGIRDALSASRKDSHIQDYASFHTLTLYVTWAEEIPANMNGVEKYLRDVLKPIERKRLPDVEPIPVNLPPPWE